MSNPLDKIVEVPELTPPVEVDMPTSVPKSEVQFGNKKAFWGLPPARLKIIIRSIQGTFGGVVTMLAATDWLSGGQVKDIATIMGIIGVVLEGVLKATGVVPLDEEKETT